ncbi:IS1595 family transposase [Nitrosomonas sp.]|uniref:IS1595 family transposase n=1 Tax=Nitrosomonas sp. TaxID=42353 RepID=UPI00272FDC5D|nr:IS1595 family transposase [Nitrosomonas sp.]MDP1786385.1 IS1595 family transposase [Nitrosomonas sp.]
MGINKIQFQKGLSMAGFMEKYGTEDKCHAALVASRWPAGFVCPKCGGTHHSTFERKGLHYWQCSICREQTTAICGTIFHATKLPLTRWFLGMHLLSQSKNSISALELKRHLGVRYKTAWLLKHKLMQVMMVREESRRLDGRVEIDDAYLGGELPGGKSGRGSENKVPFIAAVQTTETGHPLFVCLTKLAFTKDAIAQWAKKSLCASVNVVSDGLWCFRAVTESGATHERTVTGGGPACVKLEQFRAVNTLLGNLKTTLSGTYHAFDFSKYAHRYLAEFQYRFNRRFDLSVILVRLLRASSVTSPYPERLIRAAEHYG